MNRHIIIVAILLSLSMQTAQAEMPLDVITVFHSDSSGAGMWEGCMSPGDLDGDGYSELMAAEIKFDKRIFVFSGGNPPDTFPEMLIPGRTAWSGWFPDINGDGFDDFALRKPMNGTIETVEIWFGGSSLLGKTQPDVEISNEPGDFSAFGWSQYSGNVNSDGFNDLVIPAWNGIAPRDGKFCIYHGGPGMDSIMDDSIVVRHSRDSYDEFSKGSAVGDINGDGLLDYVFYGLAYFDWPSYINIILGKIPLDSVPDYTIWTPFDGFWQPGTFGETISPLGDINRDGYDDFAIGGATVWPCIFLGGDPFDTIPVILGDTADPNTRGDRISRIGDINHDGWDDIGVSYISYDFGSGIVYVYYGYRTIDPNIDIVISYKDVLPYPGRFFGQSIGPAGDFNGDGVDDLVISAEQYWGSPDYDRGNVYVLAGDPNLPTDADDTIREGSLPDKYTILEQNYPNPFNAETTIRYSLSGHYERDIDLSVFDILGRRVRTLKQCRERGGVHTAVWDGLDDNREPVSSGVYFYRLKSDDESLSKKMLLIK